MTRTTWQINVTFTKHDRITRADADLEVPDHPHHGSAEALRSPIDRDVPLIGQEIAAARALIQLAHQLLDAAARDIGEREKSPVHIHF